MACDCGVKPQAMGLAFQTYLHYYRHNLFFADSMLLKGLKWSLWMPILCDSGPGDGFWMVRKEVFFLW